MSRLPRWEATLLAVSLLLSTVGLGGEGTSKPSLYSSSSRLLWDDEDDESSFSFSFSQPRPQGLAFGFYEATCPQAEKIVASTVEELYLANSSVAAALVRLLFHDCFIHGCDASVLLDRVNGSKSEKDAIPNQTLRGFDTIDAIKSRLEEECPATVSCADVLALAARDSLVLVGGPRYPVLTGRRDSDRSFHDEAAVQIPAPNGTYATTLAAFTRRGFTERETVALLGAHSIGKVHCAFFRDRLYDFGGTGEPDYSIDPTMVAEMRVLCGGAGGTAPMEMGYYRQGREVGFGVHYYVQLLEGRGILRSDQQLTAGRTVRWVRVYATGEDGEATFRDDFAHAMVKLSGLAPLTGSEGQVRLRCSKPATKCC